MNPKQIILYFIMLSFLLSIGTIISDKLGGNAQIYISLYTIFIGGWLYIFQYLYKKFGEEK